MSSFEKVHSEMGYIAQKWSFPCDQIRRNLWIWSHLLMKSLIENFIFVQYCTKMKFSIKDFFSK